MKFCAVGVCVVDSISVVSTYPKEDEELRALSRRKEIGGNAANLCKVIAQLQGRVTKASLIYTTTNDDFLSVELVKYGIEALPIVCDGGQLPESHIIQSMETGSRTIVHYRDLEEVDFYRFKEIFDKHKLCDYDWFHFEGRNVPETCKMMEFVRSRTSNRFKISVEIEKDRGDGEQDVLNLLPFVDVVLFSCSFAKKRGFTDPKEFLKMVVSQGNFPRNADTHIVVAWGADGAFGLSVKNESSSKPVSSDSIVHQVAIPPESVVDTLGAGDTFNAGFIAELWHSEDLSTSLQGACSVAGRKCGQQGFDNLTPHKPLP
mmetsp:Transcript_2069/g.2990  ORF Transcript_2069/g.2990 Transcript_2069/m.2990 type:complete len:317 (-) Transcript_2069:1070-2020(-)